jgi:hypothetical protein
MQTFENFLRLSLCALFIPLRTTKCTGVRVILYLSSVTVYVIQPVLWLGAVPVLLHMQNLGTLCTNFIPLWPAKCTSLCTIPDLPSAITAHNTWTHLMTHLLIRCRHITLTAQFPFEWYKSNNRYHRSISSKYIQSFIAQQICLETPYKLLEDGLNQWGTGGTNPIRGTDTQSGDDGGVESHANVINFQSFRKNIPYRYFYDGKIWTFSLNVKVLTLNIHNRSEWTQSNDFEIKIPTETYSIWLINMTIFTSSTAHWETSCLVNDAFETMSWHCTIFQDVSCFSPGWRSTPTFALVFTPVPY